MVKKLSTMKSMKAVVDSLREGKKSWSELAKIEVEKKLVSEKTLDRRLRDLEFLGLAKKEGDYYVWYEYSRVFESMSDYGLAVDHSRILIPAFKSMLNLTETDRTAKEYLAAKEHLRSYPETYRKLEELEKLFTDRVRELLQKHGNKILTPDRFGILDPVRIRGKGFFGRFVGETKFKRRDVPYLIDWGKTMPSEAEMKEINEVRNWLGGVKAFNERFEVYRGFAGDISLLISKVEIGLEPLEGKCFLCPKIRFEKKTAPTPIVPKPRN